MLVAALMVPLLVNVTTFAPKVKVVPAVTVPLLVQPVPPAAEVKREKLVVVVIVPPALLFKVRLLLLLEKEKELKLMLPVLLTVMGFAVVLNVIVPPVGA